MTNFIRAHKTTVIFILIWLLGTFSLAAFADPYYCEGMARESTEAPRCARPARTATEESSNEKRTACGKHAMWATFGGAQALRGRERRIVVIERGSFLEKFSAGKLETLAGMAMWAEDATPENVESVFAGWDWAQRAKAEPNKLPASAKAAAEMFFEACWLGARV